MNGSHIASQPRWISLLPTYGGMPKLKSSTYSGVHTLFTSAADGSQFSKADRSCCTRLLANVSGIQLNAKTNVSAYASLLQACTNMNSISQVHGQILIAGFDQNMFLSTKLVSAYALCESLENARLVFDKIYKPNVFLWNVMIRWYAWMGPCDQALILYNQMQRIGIQPDNFTFPSVLKACGSLSALHQGMQIHDQVIHSRLESDIYVGNALLDMYVKCGSMESARQVFDKMSHRDVISWTAMIAGYAQNGYPNEALKLFHQMQLEDVKPNRATLVSVLPACADLSALQQGKCIHDYVKSNGYESDVSVRTALVVMYARCGCMEDACQLFDKMPKRDVVLWSAMIAGYAQAGHAAEALRLFQQMQLAGVKPNSVTMAGVLLACSLLADLQQGKWIHAYIAKSGFESYPSVGNALIDMYAKCNGVDAARQVFDKMSHRDVVSWNAMISGCVQNGRANQALSMLCQMQVNDVKPNRITLVSVLAACANLAALQQGKSIHNCIIKSGLESDLSVGTALVAMYAKSGRIEVAHQLFDKMSERDLVAWNTMIGGYGMHGHGEDAVALFLQMQQAGMKPDRITFICVLSACSHSGLVREGWHYFYCMSREYCIMPGVEHYACMVDLLGRAGQLDEACVFINKMQIEPDANVWGALLGACRTHCNFELGKHVAEQLLGLEPKNAGNYLLISNIYAAAGRWDDAVKMRKMLKYVGLQKNPGCSWIEIKSRVHSFVAGDRSHLQSETIYAMLESLSGRMRESGYAPDTCRAA